MNWKEILKTDIAALKQSYPSLKDLPDEAIREFDRRIGRTYDEKRLISELKRKFGVKRRMPVGRFQKQEIIKKDIDLMLPRGKEMVLQAEDKDYERGLLVKLLKNGGYEMAYWAGKHKPYPVEVLVDGKSIKKDAKKVTMKFHPEMEKKRDEK